MILLSDKSNEFFEASNPFESKKGTDIGTAGQKSADETDVINQNTVVEISSAVDPISDSAFKLLLSNLDIYEKFVGLMLPGEDFRNVYISNGELILSVDNKKIELDSLTESNMGWLNIEGQIREDDFPFSRHLFYWARIYANQMMKGNKNWADLKPVTVVVIYKKSRESFSKAEAHLDGTLLLTQSGRKNKDHFRLISYNAANWKDLSETDKFRPLLGLLSNGFVKAHESVEGIDLTDPVIERINDAVKISCTKTKLAEFRVKGDHNMIALFEEFLTKEEREAARVEGRVEGEIKTLVSLGKSNGEISNWLGLSIGEVENLRVKYKLD